MCFVCAICWQVRAHGMQTKNRASIVQLDSDAEEDGLHQIQYLKRGSSGYIHSTSLFVSLRASAELCLKWKLTLILWEYGSFLSSIKNTRLCFRDCSTLWQCCSLPSTPPQVFVSVSAVADTLPAEHLLVLALTDSLSQRWTTRHFLS